MGKSSIKEVAWQEHRERRVQLNIPKIVMGGFIGYNHKRLRSYPHKHERKIRKSLEINNLEPKAEYSKSIEVLNGDRGNYS